MIFKHCHLLKREMFFLDQDIIRNVLQPDCSTGTVFVFQQPLSRPKLPFVVSTEILVQVLGYHQHFSVAQPIVFGVSLLRLQLQPLLNLVLEKVEGFGCYPVALYHMHWHGFTVIGFTPCTTESTILFPFPNYAGRYRSNLRNQRWFDILLNVVIMVVY